MFELTTDILMLLFATALAASTIDAMAGGGGLLTIPVLMTTGIPPHMVLGTNKMQAICGTSVATWRYARQGLINWKSIRPAVIAALLGSALGTIVVQQISADFLKPLVPFLLMAMALYFLLSPRLSDQDSHARIGMMTFAATFAFGIAFYDGFFGPGAGSFYTASLLAFLGMNLQRATANTKLLNLSSNMGSLAMFILGGKVIWLVAAVMIPGQIIGGYCGAHLAMRHGAKLIKPVLVVVSLALSAKLLWAQFGG
ncbi:MAG: hypothetical protein EYC62_05735 [Alphaproteobacteria bacterium]|nr:MAG: hypothetical protein EYC62_05735 [Alphaproteobacteria bacterium]